ncbi:MAG: hypothetical protein ACI8X3_001012, partial [Saprospiraceae bacterium]
MLLHSDILATCSEYTIELLLWLLGAFILGYLLRWFLGAKHRNRIPVLEQDLASWQAKANDLEANLSSAKYDRDKTNEELTACKRARGDVEMKLRACKEQLEQ